MYDKDVFNGEKLNFITVYEALTKQKKKIRF